MRFVALVLAVAVVGAGVGLVSVGTAQAHGGLASGSDEVTEGTPSCGLSIAAVTVNSTCNVPRGGETK